MCGATCCVLRSISTSSIHAFRPLEWPPRDRVFLCASLCHVYVCVS